MVEFYDPVTDKNISYHIDKKLLIKWDRIRGGKLEKQDDDRVYIVDGRERAGKSVFAFQQAKYLDPTFDLSRICFTPEELLDTIRKASKGQAIVFDEAFRGLSSKGSQSKVNKRIVQALMEMGQKNLFLFIVLPTFFLLEIYPAMLRSNCLFHIYKDKKGRRAFQIYNKSKKNLLYHVGKRKGFSYAFPRTKLKGRFYGIYSIDEKSYRLKKLKSLEDAEEQVVEEENKYMVQRDKIIINSFMFFKEKGIKITQKEYSEWLDKCMVELDRRSIGRILAIPKKAHC